MIFLDFRGLTRKSRAEKIRYQHVFHDKWLPGDGSGKVISHCNILPNNALVANLIDVDSDWWNMRLLDQCFLVFKG